MHKCPAQNWYRRLVNRFRCPTGRPLFLSLGSENFSDCGHGAVLRNRDSWRIMDAVVPPLIVVAVFLLSFVYPDRVAHGVQPAFAAANGVTQFLPHFSEHRQLQPVQSSSILLIDPNRQKQLIAKTALEPCGYRLLLADNVEQGVALFGRMPQQISVVLLDWTAPGASGAMILQRLRSIRPDAKVIVSSGNAPLRHFSGNSLDGFLHAPYTADELRIALESVLRKAHKS